MISFCTLRPFPFHINFKNVFQYFISTRNSKRAENKCYKKLHVETMTISLGKVISFDTKAKNSIMGRGRSKWEICYIGLDYYDEVYKIKWTLQKSPPPKKLATPM